MTGVRQGDGLSPLLFNLVLEDALKGTKQEQRGITIGRRIQVLAFADDVALVAESKDVLMRLTRILIMEAKMVGLGVNESKTKYLTVSKGMVENERNSLKVDNFEFEQVNEFKYLGVIMTKDNREESEIHNRLAQASRTYWSLEKLFKSKWLSRKTKISIYHTIIIPVLLYESESWTLKKQSEKKLIVFGNRVL